MLIVVRVKALELDWHRQISCQQRVICKKKKDTHLFPYSFITCKLVIKHEGHY
jgi:hypothetical protein